MSAHRSWPLAFMLFVALIAHPASVAAAESYDNCTGFIDSIPVTITSQGTWCLRRDLATGMTGGYAITIDTNNVTLDCNDFKIGGLSAGPTSEAVGIYVGGKYNFTLRNCSIRGFGYGVAAFLGGGHLIEDNRFDGNLAWGIYVSSAGSTIRRNLVMATGRFEEENSEATAISGRNGVDIIDNTVDGAVSSTRESRSFNAYGIHTANNGNGSVIGNRVRGVQAAGLDGVAHGIWSEYSGRMVIQDNDIVQLDWKVGPIAIRCSDNTTTASDNVIAGYYKENEGCLTTGNTFNTDR